MNVYQGEHSMKPHDVENTRLSALMSRYKAMITDRTALRIKKFALFQNEIKIYTVSSPPSACGVVVGNCAAAAAAGAGEDGTTRFPSRL